MQGMWSPEMMAAAAAQQRMESSIPFRRNAYHAAIAFYIKTQREAQIEAAAG